MRCMPGKNIRKQILGKVYLEKVSSLHHGQPTDREPCLSLESEIPGYQYQLNMLAQFSCEVKLFCIQNYYEAEQG